jgi:hypothetical protein
MGCKVFNLYIVNDSSELSISDFVISFLLIKIIKNKLKTKD